MLVTGVSNTVINVKAEISLLTRPFRSVINAVINEISLQNQSHARAELPLLEKMGRLKEVARPEGGGDCGHCSGDPGEKDDYACCAVP